MMPAGARSVALPVHWVRWVAVFVALGAGLYLSAIVFAGADDSLRAMQRLGTRTVFAGTAIASIAYFVRFARWQWLTSRLGARLSVLLNFRVYLAGLALTPTPGKAGEILRSALLLKHGMPIRDSVAAFLADRGSDVIGIAVLGAAGGLLGSRAPVLEVAATALLVASNLFSFFIRRREPDWRRISGTAPVSNLLTGVLRELGAPVRRWSVLWTPLASAAYALFAVVAYGSQAIVLALYVHILGFDLSIFVALKIFAVAMLLGAASMVPGGLGAMEAALVYQLSELGMSTPDAVAAALALRLSTLWFAILIGVLALLSFAPRNSD